ncbi:DUF5666 domain-containing protein [Nocardia sp. NPDC051570]|uniref:DUF5666 domain-containing protein n=1 Tax=Nocardia sp. NPDC051570 TaxID=3364324 RepID=UPI00378A7660
MTHSTPSGSRSGSAAHSRARRRKILLIGTAGGVVLAAMLTACGSSGNSSSAPTSSAGPTSSAPASAAPGSHRGHAVFGTIAAENGNTWTITTREGGTETVTITSSTTFGSKNQPETQSQFAVGNQVMIDGQASGTSITATRISQPRNHSGNPAPTTTGAPATN